MCLPPLDDLIASGQLSLPLTLGPFVADVGAREVHVCIDLAALAVELVAGSDPAQIRLSVAHAKMAFQQPAVVFGKADILLTQPDAACVIDNQLGLEAIPYAADISFVVLATLAVDEDAGFSLQTDTESLTIHDIGVTVAQDCGLEECADANPGNIGDPCLECAICDSANFGTDLFEFLNDLLGESFDLVLAELLDLLSGPLLDELLNGRPLDIAAAISLHNTLGSVTESARTARDLGVLIRPAPGGFAVTGDGAQSGLELRLMGGAAAAEIHPCVGEIGTLPEFSPGPFPQFTSILPDGTPYDVGIGISEAFLNQAIWSLYETGALCLALTTREIADLTASLITIRAGLIDLLLPGVAAMAGRTASIRLVLAPTLAAEDFPVVEVSPADSDAVLRLSFARFEVGLEAFVDTDYMRLMTITSGIEADLTLTPAAAGPGFDLTVLRLELGAMTVSDHSAFSAARPDEIVALAVEVLVQVLGAGPLALPIDPGEIAALLGPTPLTADLVGLDAIGPQLDWLGVFFQVEAAP